MLLLLQEVEEFLRIDGTDEETYINELIQSAEDYLIDSIDGYETKIKNDRFKRKARMIARVLIQECYDKRILCNKDDEKLRFIISSFLTQMQYGTYEVTT